MIAESSYNTQPILDESKTTTIPSSIRTAAPFFQKKQYQVNTMLSSFGLPQIFYTMTMAEDKWPHLHEILRHTDNQNTLPSNRPLHTYLFYCNYLTNIRNKLWKHPTLSRWGKWEHFFERDEFQNHGSIHTHGFAYTEKKIPELIYLNMLRADLPDPISEPELYTLVSTFQIHHCDRRCGGPTLNGTLCSKGFPQPLSERTYYSPNTLRYIYRRTKTEDRMVVPYHPETLLVWRAHINFQYITSTGFAKYITKYITKPEPSELFDIDETDNYRKHIMARCLGAMELMILLLQYPLTRCSISVHYLPSAPSDLRL